MSDLSISPASISLTSNQNQQVTGTSHIKISSKQPADYIFGTLSPFSLEISFDTTHYTITPTEGILYYRLFHELLLHPGMEILIGTLNFELSNYNYGKSSAIGMRPTMEDNDCIIQDLHICEQPVSYYAVFDGHGGGECSRFLKVNLHEFLREQLYGVNDIAAWPGLIKQAFFQCDQSFRSSFPELSNFIGSTAVVCLIKFPNLIAINTGDSRAILSRRGDAIQLTNDHKPEVASERERIENAGGTVLCGRVMGKLGLSRAFGDFEFRSPGKEMVISEPEVEFYLINRHIDEFVVLGCDGLFEAYSNQELVKCVKEKLKRMRVTEQDPYRVIKDIVTEAVYARRTGDNITAILVSLSAGLV